MKTIIKNKTTMKVSEQIAIMKAYEDGKTIERTIHDESEWKSLNYVDDYPFDFVMNEYRIKPEPKYRPFQTIEEAFEEAKKHGFWMRDKTKKYLRMITFFDCKESGELQYIDGYCVSVFLDNFVWHDDGSPCGVKIG